MVSWVLVVCKWGNLGAMDNQFFCYVSVDGDGIGAAVGIASLADDVAEIRRISNAIDSGNAIWKAWVLANGGEVIGIGGDECRLRVPASKLGDIPSIRDQYESAVGATCTVGVGRRLTEADKSLLAGKLLGKDRVVVYSEEVEKIVAEAKQPTEQEKIAHEYLNKSDAHEDGSFELPLENLVVARSGLQYAEQNVTHSSGAKGSKSHGPLQVWRTDSGEHLLTDGYHRLVSHLLSGNHQGKVRVKVIGSGYTDYWHEPKGKDRTRLNSKLKYGNLEDIASVQVLRHHTFPQRFAARQQREAARKERLGKGDLQDLEHGDTSFDFGANDPHEQARHVINRIRDPAKKKVAQDFLAYASGQIDKRPEIHPELERHLARFGLVDPKGYTFDQYGRDMAKPVAGPRGQYGKEPEELKRLRFLNMGIDRGSALSKSEELQKSKKDAFQMYKPENPGHAEAKQHLDWAYTKMPNENWSLWTARHHRNSPQDFTPEVKQKIEHYAGSQHIPEIANVRFDKTHDLKAGLNILESAEQQYLKRTKSKLNLAPKPKTAKKLVDVGDGYAWWSLGKRSCSAEGKAMGHCGNEGAPREGDDVLSLRKEHVLGGKKYYEPHLTFINNKGFLGEMKGRGNQKPAAHYHEHIAKLLETGLVPVGGGYAPENNFHIDDLSPELKARIAAKNPGAMLQSKDVTPEHLSAAVENPDVRVLEMVVDNPKLHPRLRSDVLAKLAAAHLKVIEGGNVEELQRIARNPKLHPDLQAKLEATGVDSVVGQLATNPNLHPSLYAKLAENKDVFTQAMIAKKRDLPPDLQAKLAEDPHQWVRESLLLNPNLHRDAQIKLTRQGRQSTDYYWNTIKELSRHPNLHPDVKRMLSE